MKTETWAWFMMNVRTVFE